jgi:putative tryptophan/tyrosine transport system substrate-binding protein
VRRREFIAFVGSVVVWPPAAESQSREAVRRIGVLCGLAADDAQWKGAFAALRGGLEERGWVEGRNARFEVRHAVGNPDQFPRLAVELVQADVEVIVTQSAGLAHISRKVTKDIPIITTAGDLEGSGLIASLRSWWECYRNSDSIARADGQAP